MFSSLFRLKVMKRFGFVYYAFSRRMFRKPVLSSLFFIIEFCIISYGYVLLHNHLSASDAAISYHRTLWRSFSPSYHHAGVCYFTHYHVLALWFFLFSSQRWLSFQKLYRFKTHWKVVSHVI